MKSKFAIYRRPVKLTWANVNFQYERGCKKKKRYGTQKKAANGMRQIRKSGRLITGKPCAYKCVFCGGWHLGHCKQ